MTIPITQKMRDAVRGPLSTICIDVDEIVAIALCRAVLDAIEIDDGMMERATAVYQGAPRRMSVRDALRLALTAALKGDE